VPIHASKGVVPPPRITRSKFDRRPAEKDTSMAQFKQAAVLKVQTPLGADALLRKNLLVWGLGGVVLPFIGIKLIDVVLTAMHMVA